MTDTDATIRLVVVGAGGHGRETLDVAEAAQAAGGPWELLGVVDDGPLGPTDRERLVRRGAAYLGPLDRLVDLDATYVVAIGHPTVRAQVVARLDELGLRAAPPLIHPSVVIGADVLLGDGTVVAAGGHLTTNIRLGVHVQVNVGCIVSHDSEVGGFTTLSPGVRLNGDVTVGRGCLLGTAAIVVRGNRIGDGAVVGAGAVVLNDVPAGITVAGVPARALGPG